MPTAAAPGFDRRQLYSDEGPPISKVTTKPWRKGARLWLR